MKITVERFKALLDGTATNVTGEERVVRVEAFSAERRGEDPAAAVMARLPNVIIAEPHRMEAARPPTRVIKREVNAGHAAETPAGKRVEATERIAQVFARLNRGTLFGIYLALLIATIWIAASVNMGGLVAHFIGVALFGLALPPLMKLIDAFGSWLWGIAIWLAGVIALCAVMKLAGV